MAGARWRVDHGDAVEVLRGLPDGCCALISVDPPFYRVKGEAWDRQWDSPDAFIAWIGVLCQEWRRVLAPNGSLYVFAGPKMAARVECEIGRWFSVINSIVWSKPGTPYATKYGPENFRTFVDLSERLIFAGQRETAGALLQRVRRAAGLTTAQVCALAGAHGAANHGGAATNWERGYNTPTPAQWSAMRSRLPLPAYEDAIRPFFADAARPYTDVWTFPTVPAGPDKHPCEKPLAMLRHIVATSSRPGDLVLDCFAGSGVTGEAALMEGRRALLVERDATWAQRSRFRLARAEAQGADPTPIATAARPLGWRPDRSAERAEQLDLLGPDRAAGGNHA